MRLTSLFCAMMFVCSLFAGTVQTMDLDQDYLDLDANLVDENQPSPPFTPWDIVFQYTGQFQLHHQEPNTMIAHLSGTPYASVTFSDAWNAAYAPNQIMDPVINTSTWLIMTDQGRYFKIGNCNGDTNTWTMTFEWEELTPPPPPTRVEYLQPDADYLDLDTGVVDRQQWPAPNTMWDVKIGFGNNPDEYYVDVNTTNTWTSIGYLDGYTYSSVTFNDAFNVLWGSPESWTNWTTNRVVIIQTGDGRFFKLGNPYFDMYRYEMHFDYVELTPPPPPARTEYLQPDADYLDLDNATVDRQQWPAPNTMWDVKIGFGNNPDEYYVDVNTANTWTSIGYLDGYTYSNVTFNDAINVIWGSPEPWTNWTTNRVVIIQTGEGRFFKLGNPYFDAFRYEMHFDYVELTPPPPPARTEFLQPDADYLDLDNATVDRQQWPAPNTMWDVKIGFGNNPDEYYVDVNTTNTWTSIGYLDGYTYSNVTFNDAFNVLWSSPEPWTNWTTNRVVIIQTGEGRFFKLGNPYFDTFLYEMHFDYEELVPPPPPARTEYLQPDADYLDLDTGIVDRQQWPAPNTMWDVKIGFGNNPDEYYVDVNTSNTWTSIGYLDGYTYSNVTFNDAINVLWSSPEPWTNWTTNRVVIIQTSEGRFYKLGEPYFDTFLYEMHFDYEELVPPPPPSRVEYLQPDADYLDLDTGMVDRQQWPAPNTMWDVKIGLGYNPNEYYVDVNTANTWTSIGYLDGYTYSNVTFNDAINVLWNSPDPSTDWTTNRVVIIQTSEGRFYKLGEPYFDTFLYQMHFDYEELVPPPPPSRVEYLQPDADYLDLDTGIVDRQQWPAPNTMWDVKIGFGINPDEYYVDVNTTYWTGISFIDGSTYASVTFADGFNAPVTSPDPNTNWTNNRVVIIHTNDGRMFKLGNPYFDAFLYEMHFDYEELLPPPPPARDEYLQPDADYLDLDTGNVDRQLWPAPNTAWDVKIGLGFNPDEYYVDVNTSYWTGIAYIDNLSYAAVTHTDAINAIPSSPDPNTNWTSSRVVIIHTNDGRVYKLGNPYFDIYMWEMHFDYTELTP